MDKVFSYGSNVGTRDITHKGESRLFNASMGKVDPKATHSVESLSQLYNEGWHIYMDTRLWNGISIHKGHEVIRFPEKNGLYTYMPEDNYT